MRSGVQQQHDDNELDQQMVAVDQLSDNVTGVDAMDQSTAIYDNNDMLDYGSTEINDDIVVKDSAKQDSTYTSGYAITDSELIRKSDDVVPDDVSVVSPTVNDDNEIINATVLNDNATVNAQVVGSTDEQIRYNISDTRALNAKQQNHKDEEGIIPFDNSSHQFYKKNKILLIGFLVAAVLSVALVLSILMFMYRRGKIHRRGKNYNVVSTNRPDYGGIRNSLINDGSNRGLLNPNGVHKDAAELNEFAHRRHHAS
ncbi:hypothetical protein GJ496_003464 [Pomphorhynchus laevis]|nr:hypothetical protein GJ496_003464 [Pomphorhynchus laevis]